MVRFGFLLILLIGCESEPQPLSWPVDPHECEQGRCKDWDLDSYPCWNSSKNQYDRCWEVNCVEHYGCPDQKRKTPKE